MSDEERLTGQREEEITLLAYGWRFGKGNERDAVRQRAADAIYDLLLGMHNERQDCLRLKAERDALRAALARARDWLAIAKAFVWDEEIRENIEAQLAQTDTRP